MVFHLRGNTRPLIPRCAGHIAQHSKGWGGPPCTWAKPGQFGSFFVLCFLALGGHCLQMLCSPGFGTRANTQNLPHFRAFPVGIQEHSPPKCLFFMANAKLPNRPGFALPTSPWRQEFLVRSCPSTVLCTVPSCKSVNFRWIPSWEPN